MKISRKGVTFLVFSNNTEEIFKEGKKILQPLGFFVLEALRLFFLEIGLSSSFWIGIWKDVQTSGVV